MGGDVERWDQGPQLVVESGGALADDVLQRDGVDGDRRFGHRPRLGAAPHHDQFRLQERLERDIDHPVGSFHGALIDLKILGRRDDPVGSGSEPAKGGDARVSGPLLSIPDGDRGALYRRGRRVENPDLKALFFLLAGVLSDCRKRHQRRKQSDQSDQIAGTIGFHLHFSSLYIGFRWTGPMRPWNENAAGDKKPPDGLKKTEWQGWRRNW